MLWGLGMQQCAMHNATIQKITFFELGVYNVFDLREWKVGQIMISEDTLLTINVVLQQQQQRQHSLSTLNSVLQVAIL